MNTPPPLDTPALLPRVAFLLASALTYFVACSEAPSTPQPDAGPSPPVAVEAGACPPSYAECDNNPATLCETSLNSPQSCGACGRTCPTGPHQTAACAAAACSVACEPGFVDCDGDSANGCEAVAGLCGVETLATLSAPIGLAIDDTHVYYGTKGTAPDYTNGVLYRVPKAGGGVATLATGLNRPLNVALDDARVYWSNGGQPSLPEGSMASVPKGGGAVTTLASGMVRPGNPIVIGDRLYFSVRDLGENGRVASVLKDGSDPAVTVLAAGLSSVSDLARAGGSLVWATAGAADGSVASPPLVERCDLDGANRLQLAKGIPSPNYQIGVASDAIYVGGLVDGILRRVPLAGGNVTTIATGLVGVQELVADADFVFATTGLGRRVLAIPLAGGAPVVIADGQVFPSYLAVDAEWVYWTDGDLNAGPATIRRAKKRRR